jgi:hypothetical protein
MYDVAGADVAFEDKKREGVIESGNLMTVEDNKGAAQI